MKNSITTLCLIGSSLIILASFHVGDAIAYFLLAGIIPGTNIALSSSELLALYALVFGFIFARILTTLLSRRTIQKKA